MSATPRFRVSGNDLLDRLTQEEFGTLEPSLQRVNLTIKQIVHQFEAEVTHVYFPTTAIVSLLTVMQEDDPVEAATVGREGLVGVTVAMGVAESPHRTICQVAGESYRLPARSLQDAIVRWPAVSRLVHHYAAFVLRNATQSIACNALHTVEARTSRWLLTVHDQSGSDEFVMTQEFLAFMLGVRRQTVTVVAGSLQGAGLIRYRRGIIRIVDRSGLEDAACECYAAIRDHYRRVVG